MTARPVVVVGDVGLDVVVRPNAPPARGGDTPSRITHAPGGSGGNSASWLAAYGTSVVLLARVGRDDAGRQARRELERAGVACTLAVDPALPTCTVVVLVDDAGERTMLSDRGASRALSPADVDLAGAAAAVPEEHGVPHLHLSGFVLLARESRDAGLAVIADAQRRGWTVSVDPQAANLVGSVGASTFLGWARGVDLLLPNAAEAQALGGVAAIREVVAEVVVTHGSEGAEWVWAQGRAAAPAPAVQVVDTTGCGDAFNAGLLSAWLSGRTREEALRQGVEAGSAAAARQGARPVA